MIPYTHVNCIEYFGVDIGYFGYLGSMVCFFDVVINYWMV